MLSRRRPAAAPPSLRHRLTRDVLLPLALTWALGSALLAVVGGHFVARAFDRALLDDAYALAAQVREEGGRLRPDLSPQAMSALLFDHNETVSYALYDGGGRFAAGEPALRPPTAPAPGAAPVFADATLGGQPVRSVSLRRGEAPGFVVVMAITTAGRSGLLRQLLVASALVQLPLLLALALWLGRRIERDLEPLQRLQRALAGRSADDLAPLPPALAAEAGTRDLQQLGHGIDDLLRRLKDTLDAQREFAGTVAHELRTPLAGIRAQADYALAQHDPAVWRGELQAIVQAQQRASRLIDQLLVLARAGERPPGALRETVVLDALVRGCVLRWLPRADALGVDLGAEGLDEPAPVQGDAALIEGLLDNLIDNALRYGRGTPPRLTVALEPQPAQGGDDAAVRLSVTDNGPGLDADEAAAALQRWRQGPAGRRLGEGAGLGLAIVQRHAALLGARLELAPGPQGRGLSVRLWLRAAG